jgi:hypothetical protein
MVDGFMPDGIALETVGTWRLSGLRESLELFQVRTVDLLGEFPPPRAVAMTQRS